MEYCLLLACWWCVRVKERKHFSALGTKPYFHVNSSRKNSILLTTNTPPTWPPCCIVANQEYPRLHSLWQELLWERVKIWIAVSSKKSPSKVFYIDQDTVGIIVLSVCEVLSILGICVSSAVSYILAVGWDVWSGRHGVILDMDW